MAKVCYLSTTGSNANSGLTAALPKLTVAGVRAITAAGDRVSIAGGAYIFTSETFSSANDNNVVWMPDGSGQVFFSANNASSGLISVTTDRTPIFIQIHFKDVSSAGTLVTASTSTTSFPRFIHCVFYSTLGVGTRVGANRVHAENCSFYGLNIGYTSATSSNPPLIRGCYFKSCTASLSVATAYVRAFNAMPSNTELDGINTSLSNNDPGFRNVDFASGTEDFRLHPTADTVAYGRFKTLGYRGAMVGAVGTPGPYYDSRFAPTRMITPDPAVTTGTWPAWENDTSYSAAGTLGAIVQDATTGALKLDLASTPTATDGRARSGVMDAGSGRAWNLSSIVLEMSRDIQHGAAIDSNDSLPVVYEYRGRSTSFLIGDGSPTWETIEKDATVTKNYRYVQFRATFWRTHTNA